MYDDEYTEGVNHWELAELVKHVLRGECPQSQRDERVNGCSWADDCLACWLHYGMEQIGGEKHG